MAVVLTSDQVIGLLDMLDVDATEAACSAEDLVLLPKGEYEKLVDKDARAEWEGLQLGSDGEWLYVTVAGRIPLAQVDCGDSAARLLGGETALSPRIPQDEAFAMVAKAWAAMSAVGWTLHVDFNRGRTPAVPEIIAIHTRNPRIPAQIMPMGVSFAGWLESIAACPWLLATAPSDVGLDNPDPSPTAPTTDTTRPLRNPWEMSEQDVRDELWCRGVKVGNGHALAYMRGALCAARLFPGAITRDGRNFWPQPAADSG